VLKIMVLNGLRL